MKLPRDTNPALIASDDETRWAISHVRIEDSHAIATDGRMLIVQQVEMEDGDQAETHIPAAFLAEAVQAVVKFGEHPRVQLEAGALTYASFSGDRAYSMEHPSPGPSYPNWRGVLPSPSDRIPITFNSRFLRRLARAMGAHRSALADAVTIWVDPANLDLPMVVTAPAEQDRFAILMPVRPKAENPDVRDYRENAAWRWARREELIAEAKAACLAAGEFWTPEKEEAALATADGKAGA